MMTTMDLDSQADSPNKGSVTDFKIKLIMVATGIIIIRIRIRI